MTVRTVAGWAFMSAFMAAALLNTVRLYGERDACVRRAIQAERDNADLLDLINGRKAILEHKNGRQIYTVFKPRRTTTRPTIIMAEAK